MQVLHITYTKPAWHTTHPNIPHAPCVNTNPAYRHKELQTNTQSNSPKQQIYQTPTDLNLSVLDLLRYQTDLAHNMQPLHQQPRDSLHNIAKSSALQENVHFFNHIPIFKAKDPQLFDEWLDQIDKVEALINNDPYKLALAKSQGSFSKTISSYPPTLGQNKIKECLHYNFGSIDTKQHTTSMLIDQQQKPSETLQQYGQRFLDLLLKSSGLLPHQAQDLAYITYFIRNLHNQNLQHYILGKKPKSVQNAITLIQKKDVELKIIEGLHNHNLEHEIHNYNLYQNDNLITLDPTMHVMVLISLKIVMSQPVLDVNLTLIIIPHLNAPGDASPFYPLTTTHLTKYH